MNDSQCLSGRRQQCRRKEAGITGFTLLETVVAISLLVTASVGPLMLSSSTIRATRDARNELVATLLAEEGVEMIRNIRDNLSADDNADNITTPRTDWMDSQYYTPCSSDSGCIFDIRERAVADSDIWKLNQAVFSPSGSVSPNTFDSAEYVRVWLNPTSGFFIQAKVNSAPAGFVDSGFRRWIEFTNPQNDANGDVREFDVHVYVSYQGVGGRKVVHVTDHLMNWFPYIH
jgi:Tfp pilus assembly protein PilV